ncbi:VirB4 family type IV secretion/conjugal transfer ATPase [Lelliottia nimipressuralis]|uniref:VirB3 family type IV secretion system protein n=1 Tax=Lelliottia nimipressuralis TaxID=69220 RepID=A0ABD4K4V8_9ENTR|nr:VirB3 family type IV secretion system protein [Lelliottia nimipressuralis]MBF4176500.1 VirB3 family type IV secretion system protein [Lelliottia nimipressuralis]
MAKLLKAMKRPAALWGVPMVPLLGVSGVTIIVAVWTSVAFLALLPVEFLMMKSLTRNEPMRFSLIAVWLRARGKPAANRLFGATAFMPVEHEAVDITEFLNAMKLNQCATLRKYIPYSSHIHQHVVRSPNSDLYCTWELTGTPFDCESEDTLSTDRNQLHGLIRSFEGMPITFYIHNVREPFTDSLHKVSGNPYADEISRLYYASLAAVPFRRNRLFLTVCYRPFVRLEKAGRRRMNDGQKLKELDGALREILEIKGSLDTALSRYAARPLGTFTEGNAVFSSQLAFYEYLLTHQWRRVRVTRAAAYSVMGSAALFFSAESGQINHASGTHYFRGLEVKEFPEVTATGMMDSLLYAPCDYVITQTYTCMSREEARKAIKRTRRLLMSSDDDAVSQRLDLDVALDLLTSGKIACGRHHFSIMVFSRTLDSLVADTGEISNALNNLGITPVPAALSLSAAYMAQLPGNYHLRPRLGELSSLNFVELAALHNFYPGKRDNAPWGDAMALLRTPSGDGYYLNLHNTLADKDEFNEKNPASTCILGTNGSGKTMLMTFLENMQQKYGRADSFSPDAKTKRLTTVYLDKDRGAEMNIRALGGRYFRITHGDPTGWNPFSLSPTKRNISFISQLMKLLCTRNGATITPRDERRLNDAVNAVMSNEPQYRVCGITRLLENLPEPATKEAQENGLSIRLSQWAQGGEFGWVFDNASDTFDISHCDNFGIDGTEFLDDANVCAPISFYLLYRITSLLDGRRLVIFMDEFWKWLRDPVFKDFAYNRLKTIRKLNGMLVVGTQSPAEIIRDEIAPAVIEQCGTQILAANPGADRAHYVDGMKFEPEVFDVVKSLDPQARQYVVVKNQFRRGDTKRFAARVTLDLSGIGRYTRVMSGSADNLEIFDSLYREGMLPHEWLDSYLAQAL